jgi:hypothetical protein
MSKTISKKVNELTLGDFSAHPLWTWDDEDEDTVVPQSYLGALPDEDNDALFVSCELSLHDGTKMTGVLSVRTRDHRVYTIDFPMPNGKFFPFPLQSRLKDLVKRDALATQLGKSREQIFPIAYTTPYTFSDGQPLVGHIE